MKLDMSKLKKVSRKEGKTVAQCPVCAEKDGDSKGNHLVIFDNGKYSCIAHPNDQEHSSRIWTLAGPVGQERMRTVVFEVKPFKTPEKQVFKTYGYFGWVDQNSYVGD